MPAEDGPTNPARRWPSVAAQLEQAQARPGTALEQLIRENQDTHLLRPDEQPDDAVGLPLWLRVYYRKNHPDEPIPAVDPAGGYPDVLYRVLDWMLQHQDLPWGTRDDTRQPDEEGRP